MEKRGIFSSEEINSITLNDGACGCGLWQREIEHELNKVIESQCARHLLSYLKPIIIITEVIKHCTYYVTSYS